MINLKIKLRQIILTLLLTTTFTLPAMASQAQWEEDGRASASQATPQGQPVQYVTAAIQHYKENNRRLAAELAELDYLRRQVQLLDRALQETSSEAPFLPPTRDGGSNALTQVLPSSEEAAAAAAAPNPLGAPTARNIETTIEKVLQRLREQRDTIVTLKNALSIPSKAI